MCGISGIFNAGEELNQELISSSAYRLKERGPDHQAHLSLGPHTIYHSRLKIIDLSDDANQPMSNGQHHLVFNGEIYNFQALKEKLKNLGQSFRTQSDTEIILKGYDQWGINGLVKELDGMFAFCLFDESNRQVFLARDRFGKKPLYYFHNGDQLAFSSDIRVLRDLYASQLSVDINSIFYYLTELSVPQPHTIYNEIKQVKPAHYLTLDLTSAHNSEDLFWRIPLNPQTLTMDEYLEHTEGLLQKAIAKRLVADVPVGCFLSGGVDSGLITALAAQSGSQPISTFSVGMDYAPYNELEDARIVAERYQTNHTELMVKPDIEADITGLMQYAGEPFADSSLLPSYYICKEIGKHITVALSGDGGDEGFGGYNDYGLAHRTDKYYAPIADSPLAALKVWTNKIGHKLSGRPGENLGSYRQYHQQTDAHKLFRDMSFFASEQQPLWLDQNKFKKSREFVFSYWDQIWNANQRNNTVDQLMQSSLQTRLLNDYLVKVDRSSMINSLEVRSPFLDTELVSFALNIPHEVKFHKDINKYLLKKIAQKHVDSNIFTRPKRGFGIPIHLWLKKELADFSEEVILGSEFLDTHFDKSLIRQMISQHQSGQKSYTHQLWAFLCLSLWNKSIQ